VAGHSGGKNFSHQSRDKIGAFACYRFVIAASALVINARDSSIDFRVAATASTRSHRD
jgi:hypothetical protein